MDFPADIPITLIVKAPNQRIADHPVECMLGWTIRKLKEHLENHYPSKPKHNQQKLIYSGKLLSDHLTLKEVLRQDEELQTHTLHLVCSPTSEGPLSSTGSSSVMTNPDMTNTKPMSSASSSDPLPSTSMTPDSEGLRLRLPATQSVPDASGFNPWLAQQLPVSGMQNYPSYPYPGMNVQQYLYMQQMYSQYMAQYMQYYQTASSAVQNTVTPTPPPTPAPAPAANANNAAPANQNMHMNAQGGMADDDEDEMNRDWLDYIYISFRFLVLLSIVYFYSNISRFVAVFGGFVLIYLLQNGWLWGMRQRPARQENQQEEAQPPETQEEAMPPQENNAPTIPAADEVDSEASITQVNEEGDQAETVSQGQLQAGLTPSPSILSIAWCFLCSFFTSLIPQHPEAVNLN